MADADQIETEPCSGSGSTEGQVVQPGPAPSEPSDQQTESPVTSIPLGMPASLEEYRRQKQQAERPIEDTEEAAQDNVAADASEAISQGLPVSPDEYQRLKREAEQPDDDETPDNPDEEEEG